MSCSGLCKSLIIFRQLQYFLNVLLRLVGHGTMPFEGDPMELLHSVVQKRPMPVHEVRRDVPQVLANIVDKVSFS